MRILVTGGTGFLGRYVMREIPLDCETLHLSHKTIAAARPMMPDVIVNLAWPPCDYESRMDDALQSEGPKFARQLMSLYARRGVKVIGIGSQAEVTTPDTPYARRKTETHNWLEHCCALYGMPFCWVRVFSLYGPGDCEKTFISYVARELLSGRTPALTDQNIPWDFLHVEDAARAIVILALNNATGTFDLGSGTMVGTMNVAAMIRDKIDPAAQLGFGQRQARAVEVPRLQADIGPLLRLGWKPRIMLSEGLDTVVKESGQHNPKQPLATARTQARGTGS